MSLLSDAGVNNREAVEAMPKTIKRTLSGSEMAPPFHRTRRISLNYCAAYFFRKDGVCVALAYFFPGRVRRLFLPGTLQVRSKHVNDTVRYGNFFLTPTVCFIYSLPVGVTSTF